MLFSFLNQVEAHISASPGENPRSFRACSDNFPTCFLVIEEEQLLLSYSKFLFEECNNLHIFQGVALSTCSYCKSTLTVEMATYQKNFSLPFKG
jgi:hypothetical protein